MPRRTRSILIDATLGKIFATAPDVILPASIPPLTTSATATAASLVGGSTLKSIQRNYGTSGTKAKITNNVVTSFPFPAKALITSVKVMVNPASTSFRPQGKGIHVRIKSGLTYQTSTDVGIGFWLDANQTENITPCSLTFAAGYTLYWDIFDVGSGTKPGIGLSITIYYYIGY